MVLVEDVTGNSNNATNNEPSSSNNSQSQTNSNNDNQQGQQQQQQNENRMTLSEFVTRDKISFILFLTRIFTILCVLLYLFPFSGYDQVTLYHKALLACAATSALRLHQRLAGVGFQLSRAYFQRLIAEDSCHYLLYAFIFMNSYPITVVLMPVFLFALLHVSSYTKTLLNFHGENSFGFIRSPVNYVVFRSKDVMRLAAVNEIILMPILILMIFSGKSGIFIPFIYYRFICLRYKSDRNPYNKMMFRELRLVAEYYTSQPNCPAFVRNLCSRIIGFVCRLEPVN